MASDDPHGSDEVLPPFRVRNLYSESEAKILGNWPPRALSPSQKGCPKIVMTTQEYDATVSKNPAASLLYLDPDDGELVTTGSALELSMKISDPTPPPETSHSFACPEHMFDIRPEAVPMWRSIESQNRLLAYPKVSESSRVSVDPPLASSSTATRNPPPEDKPAASRHDLLRENLARIMESNSRYRHFLSTNPPSITKKKSDAVTSYPSRLRFDIPSTPELPTSKKLDTNNKLGEPIDIQPKQTANTHRAESKHSSLTPSGRRCAERAGKKLAALRMPKKGILLPHSSSWAFYDAKNPFDPQPNENLPIYTKLKSRYEEMEREYRRLQEGAVCDVSSTSAERGSNCPSEFDNEILQADLLSGFESAMTNIHEHETRGHDEKPNGPTDAQAPTGPPHKAPSVAESSQREYLPLRMENKKMREALLAKRAAEKEKRKLLRQIYQTELDRVNNAPPLPTSLTQECDALLEENLKLRYQLAALAHLKKADELPIKHPKREMSSVSLWARDVPIDPKLIQTSLNQSVETKNVETSNQTKAPTVSASLPSQPAGSSQNPQTAQDLLAASAKGLIDGSARALLDSARLLVSLMKTKFPEARDKFRLSQANTYQGIDDTVADVRAVFDDLGNHMHNFGDSLYNASIRTRLAADKVRDADLEAVNQVLDGVGSLCKNLLSSFESAGVKIERDGKTPQSATLENASVKSETETQNGVVPSDKQPAALSEPTSKKSSIVGIPITEKNSDPPSPMLPAPSIPALPASNTESQRQQSPESREDSVSVTTTPKTVPKIGVAAKMPSNTSKSVKSVAGSLTAVRLANRLRHHISMNSIPLTKARLQSQYHPIMNILSGRPSMPDLSAEKPALSGMSTSQIIADKKARFPSIAEFEDRLSAKSVSLSPQSPLVPDIPYDSGEVKVTIGPSNSFNQLPTNSASQPVPKKSPVLSPTLRQDPLDLPSFSPPYSSLDPLLGGDASDGPSHERPDEDLDIFKSDPDFASPYPELQRDREHFDETTTNTHIVNEVLSQPPAVPPKVEEDHAAGKTVSEFDLLVPSHDPLDSGKGKEPASRLRREPSDLAARYGYFRPSQDLTARPSTSISRSTATAGPSNAGTKSAIWPAPPSRGSFTISPSAAQRPTSSSDGPLTPRIAECISALESLGYGDHESEVAKRLRLYATAAKGDLGEAIDMIEEEINAYKHMMRDGK